MQRIAIIALVLGLVAAACSGAGEDEPLTVYSGRSEDLVGPVIEGFTEATGIEVEVRYGDSAELATTLTVEGEASPADVFFAQDPASLGLVAQAGLFDALPDEVVDLVPARFADPSGRWVGTSGRVRVFVYNTDAVDEADLPASIWDVTGPRWTDVLGVAPTNGSFLSFVAAMILDEGEERTLEWLEAVAANDPVDFAGNSPIVEAVDLGEIEAGLVNHYYLLRRQAELGETTATNWFIPAGDAGSLVMTAGAGLVHDSEDARAFIEYLLSTGTQEYFATETFEYPLLPGVPAPDGLPSIDEVATPDIDLSDLSAALERAIELVAEAGLV
jgi:iron(III) transport system substrate-binding protein